MSDDSGDAGRSHMVENLLYIVIFLMAIAAPMAGCAMTVLR